MEIVCEENEKYLIEYEDTETQDNVQVIRNTQEEALAFCEELVKKVDGFSLFKIVRCIVGEP